jgi:putative ABC transport system permease protein
MNQILESIAIALDGIWSNKLRSFMTVLGNVVAVTSIVTVVSLIQGMNSMVSKAIVSDVGADSFTIQRRPPVRSLEDEERTRNNPLVTLDEARAIRAFSPSIAAVAAQANRRGTVTYRDQVIDGVQIQGVTEEYVSFSAFDAEHGRLISPSEVQRSRPVVLLGAEAAARLFGEINPIDKEVRIGGVNFHVFES